MSGFRAGHGRRVSPPLCWPNGVVMWLLQPYLEKFNAAAWQRDGRPLLFSTH